VSLDPPVIRVDHLEAIRGHQPQPVGAAQDAEFRAAEELSVERGRDDAMP